jgi:hypothetical protein
LEWGRQVKELELLRVQELRALVLQVRVEQLEEEPRQQKVGACQLLVQVLQGQVPELEEQLLALVQGCHHWVLS